MTQLFIQRLFSQHCKSFARESDGSGRGGSSAYGGALRHSSPPPYAAVAGGSGAAGGCTAGSSSILRPLMDFSAFCTFCAAWEQRHTPAAVRYFFQILDLEGKGHLTPVRWGVWDGSGRVVPSCVPALHGMLRKGRCSSISPGKCWLQLERTVLNGPCRRTCTRSSGRCTACGWRRGSTQVGLILPQGSLQELCFIDSVGRAACSTAAAKLAHCPSASPAGPLPKSNLPSMLLVAAAPSLLTHYCARLRCCKLKSVLVKHPQ